MSVVSIIVKTIVKVIYAIIQIFSILGEGVLKLSTTLCDNLVKLDKKLTKEFEKKAEEFMPE